MDLTTLEYPRHVHRPVSREAWDAGERVFCVVRDAAACEQAVADGWSLTPILIDPARPTPPDPPLVPESVKRGPGRPRKGAK